jgi:SOS response regulatory protein OraA/RecX
VQPVVTALRARGPARVEVHLDGSLWRVVPLACVADARLAVGVALDRERARTLNRSLKGQRALGVALRALRATDHTRASLDARLAQRGVGEEERTTVLSIVERAGLVDDERLAAGRAETLARRGYGDAAILADLERRGVAETAARTAVGALDPESVRASRVLVSSGRRGLSAARFLATRGFGDDTLEGLVAVDGGEGLG